MVMALGRNSSAVGGWLHHPVVVGRLMPTLIRRRDVGRRNICFTLSRAETADARAAIGT
jgi:hypothetical protein